MTKQRKFASIHGAHASPSKSCETPGRFWRMQTDDLDHFDELVVGQWFHIERMDSRVWWMRIGEQDFMIGISPEGVVSLRFNESGKEIIDEELAAYKKKIRWQKLKKSK